MKEQTGEQVHEARVPSPGVSVPVKSEYINFWHICVSPARKLTSPSPLPGGQRVEMKIPAL